TDSVSLIKSAVTGSIVMLLGVVCFPSDGFVSMPYTRLPAGNKLASACVKRPALQPRSAQCCGRAGGGRYRVAAAIKRVACCIFMEAKVAYSKLAVSGAG